MDITKIVSDWFRAYQLAPPPIIRVGGIVILPDSIARTLTLEQFQSLERFIEDQGLELRLTKEGGKHVR